MTSDGKSKLQAVLSPSDNQIAYIEYEQCPVSENCLPSVVILDMEGRRLKTFHPMPEGPGKPCASILGILWLTETSIAAQCHINPSLSEYVETDLRSGKTVRDLLGCGFTPSPDRKYVAHIGPIVHFAPPIHQSKYLQIDQTTVYPLPKGAQPTEREPDVVRQKRGSTWIGVHEFVSKFFWSPDSERIAFVDCLFDWIEKGVGADGATPIGDRTNRRCFVAVVSRTGQSVLFPIGGRPDFDANTVNFLWDGPNQLVVQIAGTSRKFSISKN